MRRWTVVTLTTAALIGGLLTTVPAQAAGTLSCPVPVAGKQFASADPAKLGLDPEELESAITYASDQYSTSVRVYRHGCLAGSSDKDAVTQYAPAPLASSSKGVFSLALGRAVTMGKLRLDDRIGKWLPEASGKHARLTVRTLLNQTSGLKFSWSDEVAGLATDPLTQVLGLPFEHPVGSTYEYHQTTLSVLGIIVERATKQDLAEFMQQQLFSPVGIPRDHWVWLRDRAGNLVVGGGMLLRPDDQARLGQLMLNDGRWAGRQLVSSRYLREAVHGTSANPGYGYLFWTNHGDRYKLPSLPKGLWHEQPFFPGTPRDAYSFVGAGGQIIVVVPSRDMVIVRNGGPSRIEPTDQAKYTSASTSPDLKEMVRRIVRSVDDMPDNTDPGPMEYDYPSEDWSQPEYWPNIVDASMVLGSVLRFAAAQDPSCNVFVCGDQNFITHVIGYGADVLGQVAAAVAATARDAATG